MRIFIITFICVGILVLVLRHFEATSVSKNDTILKTQVLSQEVREHESMFHYRSETFTTFMIYYKNDTKKAVTVSNQSPQYDALMSKLDI